jgi:hypothetical protein
MTDFEIARCVRGALPNENLILVDADAARIAGADVPDNVLAIERGFIAMSRLVLHGCDGERLRARSARILGILPKSVPDALTKYLSEPISSSTAGITLRDMACEGNSVENRSLSDTKEQRLARAAALIQCFDPSLETATAERVANAATDFLPCVVEHRFQSPIESVQLRARSLLEALYWVELTMDRDSVLPFGVRFKSTVKTSRTGCGGSCGMGMVSTESRTFVGFVSR